jgi:polysaccharide pyruvyl transferase WcaK-like protein
MKIVVYGYYFHKNVGDDLFIEAFKHLFPEYTFRFTDVLTNELVQWASAVFIGGGSLLFGAPNIEDLSLLLKSKNIFYIGVGVEQNIHPVHLELMLISKLIAIRSEEQLERVIKINKNTIVIPDIVYSLPYNCQNNKANKSILVFNNFAVVPSWDEPHWKHCSWGYFKTQFSEFLDYLKEQNYTINFLPMSNDNQINDANASIEIINCMKNKDENYLLSSMNHNFGSITDILSKYSFIITQRFHGIVLAEICNIPYIALYHHDKLQKNMDNNGNFISYFGASKQVLIDNFNEINNSIVKNKSDDHAINAFDMLKIKVHNILNGD